MTKMINQIGTWNVNAAVTGRHVKIATSVVLANGSIIRFMEKLSKKAAIQNALHAINSRPEQYGLTQKAFSGLCDCAFCAHRQ